MSLNVAIVVHIFDMKMGKENYFIFLPLPPSTLIIICSQSPILPGAVIL